MDSKQSTASIRQQLKGMKATVMGLAREGTVLTRFLVEGGAEVMVTDMKPAAALEERLSELAGLPVHYALGSHPVETLECDVLFVSPGVPLDAPLVVEARRRGLTLSSESRLFCRLCPQPVAGITGSSGKTTTASLLAAMLEAAGRRVHLGGNIGNPLILRLPEIQPGDAVVMELSSFQLDFFGPVLDAEPHGNLVSPLFPAGGWSPPVAAVLNVTPNHLDRHPTLEAYIHAKSNILRFGHGQDRAVLGWDDPVARGLAGHARGRVAYFSLRDTVERGAYLQGDALVLRGDAGDSKICSTGEVLLRGVHNIANVLAACALADWLGVPAAAMTEVARSFRGVEHRLELVRRWQDVSYYNDSIATSPERAMAALRSFEEPIVLLAGGRDKHLPWGEWAQEVSRHVVNVISFGEAAGLIEDALGRLGPRSPRVLRAKDLAHAVELACSLARPGQVVLLSPGGTSYDAFGDYTERGRTFKRLVQALGDSTRSSKS